MTNRPLVVYHSPCADGFGAAWAFYHRYKDNAEYVQGRYSEAPPDVTDRDVYLVDFSYKRAVVEGMLKVAKSVTLIDHHKTALEDLANLEGLNYFTDLNHSGAILAWKFLFGDIKPPTLMLYVEDRDLWRFSLPDSREVSAALFSYPYEFATWDMLMNESLTPISKLVIAGESLERKQQKEAKELAAFLKRTLTIGGYAVPVANVPFTLASDVGHILCQGQPFAATYTDTEEFRMFSLRSDEHGMDVSSIASAYGGGGHPHAAGFRVPRFHNLALS